MCGILICIYTDFDDLQREFRKCFRAEGFERQTQFFWWNQLLETACKKSNFLITEKLYHGVSKELTLSTYSGTYYGMTHLRSDIDLNQFMNFLDHN